MTLPVAGDPTPAPHTREAPIGRAAGAPARESISVLFAGGGSGGHIAPGLAIAERLIERSPDAKTVFACSERPIDEEMLSAAGAAFTPVPAVPVSLRPGRLLRFLRSYGRTRHAAFTLIRSLQPDVVVSLGGFVAAPVVAAARRFWVPVVLMNLDAKPGRANRWMALSAAHVLSAVPTPTAPAFNRRIDQVVGMPLRRIALAPADAPDCRKQLGLDPELPTLLITGASQGASSLNDLMVAILRERPAMLAGWQVLHLCGAGADESALHDAYTAAGVPARVLPFLHRIGLAWGSADVALSRAGANSVAEAAANSVPALFLPYPYHRDQHQRMNAAPLVEAGGARMADDAVDPARNLVEVAPELETLLTRRDLRERMRTALKALVPADAAATVAELLLRERRGR